MNNNHREKNGIHPAAKILITGCMIAGFWGTSVLGLFQMYARLRFSLPTFSIFDYILLGLGFLAGVIGAKILKNKSDLQMLIGYTGTTITAYIGYLILPVMPFANQYLPPYHIGPIEMSFISPILGFLSLFGILSAGSMFHLLFFLGTKDQNAPDKTNNKERVGQILLLTLSLTGSATIGYVCTYLRQDSHGSLVYLSISGLVGITGLLFTLKSRLFPRKSQNMSHQDRGVGSIGKQPWGLVRTVITWLFFSIGMVILLHLVNVAMADPRESVVFQLFYANAIVGSVLSLLLILLVVSPLTGKIRGIALALLGFGSALLMHWSIKQGLHTQLIFRYVCYGMGLIAFILVGVEQFSKSQHPKFFASAFVLALGMSGYTSFIPAKMPSLVEGTSSLLMDIALGVTVGSVVFVEIIEIYLQKKRFSKFIKN